MKAADPVDIVASNESDVSAEQSVASDSPPEHSADVGGRLIEARSVTEAAALNMAGAILDETEPKTHKRELIQSLSELLEAYGLLRAARTLRERYIRETD
ncbi:hypothetical protein [Lacipirellula parvula]|uniref:Uncharacterized protein n=1 Tax=Lacipirellula parvula TaxID=2650471 RepID=A0A5K7X8S8_9BACT|nr:hypothetical protein [Lacipirellula parvula]BBO32267.1 hypothetical protein PLANPX_1879 [Lacipirellula parvula]